MPMTSDMYLLITSWLALGGVFFAGYLSAVRLITKKCAFNESCPYFLGFPSCWYGFTMFLVLFGAALSGRTGYITVSVATNTLLSVSLLGILFAGYFSLQELIAWLRSPSKSYSLGLPTCSYGLVFYVIIFALSLYQ